MEGTTTTYDVAVIGGGPAGSTCARALVDSGARVVVIDRSVFPRVKLCAGWLSPAIWRQLELLPREYPRGLWEWNTCHVHYLGKDHAIRGKGWFIRRFELDEFLLRRCGAELRLGVHVKKIERDGNAWVLELPDGTAIRARYLVGAGGTHCPVARLLAPPRPRRAVGVQELELQTDRAAVERTRLGRDGEPELVLFDGVGGYGWNVPKSDWINVGCGTLDANAVRGAWQVTHDHLRAAGHVPAEAEPELEHVKGHSYFLYDPAHLEGASRDNALLVGDSLGLAHPITAEGILPAVVSGRCAAEAIIAGNASGYGARLASDELIADYRRVHRLVAAASKLKHRAEASESAQRGSNGKLQHRAESTEGAASKREHRAESTEGAATKREHRAESAEGLATASKLGPGESTERSAQRGSHGNGQQRANRDFELIELEDLAGGSDRAAGRRSQGASQTALTARSGLLANVGRYAVARGFGWMFSGARLPMPRLLDRVLDLLPNGR